MLIALQSRLRLVTGVTGNLVESFQNNFNMTQKLLTRDGSLGNMSFKGGYIFVNEERGFGVDPSPSMTEYVPQSISEQHPPHQLLSMLLPVLPALAKALGPDAEVVLHDLTEPNNGIIGIEGNVTGRKVGGPTTDLVLKMIKQGNANHMLNYRARTSDGRILRSSTIFLKDESGALVGALCINIDISFWLNAKGVGTLSLLVGLQSRRLLQVSVPMIQ